MKLLFILATVLAFSLAEEVDNDFKEIADSEAVASNLELLKESADLTPAANSYRSGQYWQPPQTWTTAANNYHWTTAAPPQYYPSPSTQTPVIKNEFYMGDGNYNYEYKLGDGTWVGEQGYYTSPNREEDSLVKKGWYSYVGADGKTYTVSWYADKTGYHAFGDHLPKAPVPQQPTHGQHHDEPVVPTTAKPVYPTYTPRPVHPVHPTYPPRPIYPSVPNYTPEPHYPSNIPVITGPWPTTTTPQPQHPSYVPSQPTYIPTRPEKPIPVPPYNPPQQTYYPQQQPAYYPQQTYVPNYNV